MKIIKTFKAPAAIGPYSQGVVSNSILYTSGSLGIDPETDKLALGIEEQTKLVLNNLNAILLEAGSDLSKVIKTTIFLKDLNDFQIVNKIYEEFFEGHFPARSTVEVARLPKDALIEIELIAAT